MPSVLRRFVVAAIVAGVSWVTRTPALAAQAEPVVTFSEHLRPVVLQKCASCHRPGGSAPFSLLTYEDLRARARQVVTAVVRRQMPPWLATTDAGHFVGERRLPDEEIRLFERWLETGASRGGAERPPSRPSATRELDATQGWRFGPPDLVLRLPAPYRLAAGRGDLLRTFVLPVDVPTRRFVRAWEFRTSREDVVHHATLMVDPGGSARVLDAQDPEPGYEGLIPLSAQSPEGYFLGWTPGQQPYEAPAHLSWPLTHGSDLLAMLHLRQQSVPASVDISIGLYFADEPPSTLPVMIRLNRQDLDIPAGAADVRVSDALVLPVDVELYGVQPHAHYLAREVTGTARLPDGSVRSLVQVKDWNFHWQDVYRYAAPVFLPAGTQLGMEFHFDNSPGNRSNPNVPPRRVRFGQRSSDEMADLWLQVVPVRAADREVLVTALHRKLLPELMQGHRAMLEADPDNAALHDELALMAVEIGDPDLAIVEFRASLRLKPATASAQYNVGNALLMRGREQEALGYFLEATRLAPDYGLAHQGAALAYAAGGALDQAIPVMTRAAALLPLAAEPHYNLGVLLQRAGKAADALKYYERAVALRPGHPDALYAIGILHSKEGRHAAAVSAFRQAVQSRREWAAAEAELAWLLAVSADPGVKRPDEATAIATRALAAGGPASVRAADALAAALAASGDYAGAVRVLEQCLAGAPGATAPLDRSGLESRLERYRRGEPFHLQPH